jgi:hypothetical protein
MNDKKNMHRGQSRTTIVLVLAFLLLLVGRIYAAVAELNYNIIAAAPAIYHSAVAAVETTDWVAPLKPRYTKGNPSVTAYAANADASATCVLECGLYHYDEESGDYTFLGKKESGTLTAEAAGTLDGVLFPVSDLVSFDTRGANVFDVRITALSAGLLTTRVWAYGGKSGAPIAPDP